jgi:glutamate 5-kinase
MNRRLFLSIFTGSIFTASGCLETVQRSSNDQTATHNPRRASSGGLVAKIQATTGFMRSSVEEGITANFNSDKIVIRGSYRPPTSCHDILIDKIKKIGNNTVRIVISQRETEGNGVCEGGFVFYRLLIDGPMLPSSIQIIHSNTRRMFTVTEDNPGTLSPIPPITTTTE